MEDYIASYSKSCFLDKKAFTYLLTLLTYLLSQKSVSHSLYGDAFYVFI